MNGPSRWSCAVLLLSCLWLGGCLPVLDPDSEEKNPLIGDARAKKAAYNFPGAVASLEKAIEGNPRLALAHWELGLIYCQNVNNPAAAIYHFERLLKLRPDWRQADTVRQLINVCKIELAKNVPLGPQTPAAQQQLDRLTTKVHELANDLARLNASNQVLRLQLQQFAVENAQLRERLSAALARPPTATTPVTPQPGVSQPVAPRPEGSPAGGPQQPAQPVAPSPSPRPAVPQAQPSTPAPTPSAGRSRTYTVRRGETLTQIAQRHGIKLRDLIIANPNVRPERLKPGQTLRIP